MRAEFDALVIGAGPAGTAAAIGLAQAGWRVCVAERETFPRRKVCGESLSAAGIELLDALGIGSAFRAAAGPELDQVGWMRREDAVVAPFPRCTDGRYAVGRALGREHLDVLLLERARALGVHVEQPARVRSVEGRPGSYQCALETAVRARQPSARARYRRRGITARVVIGAYGSWSPEPALGAEVVTLRRAECAADLFAFKANFRHASLPAGLLSVIAFAGGYGGIVEAEQGRTTLACCIRRDALARCRRQHAGASAGIAVEAALREECLGVRRALEGATREGAWLAVGPIRPGIRVRDPRTRELGAVFRVGNAAGETHPLIGEGITMALNSARLLSGLLGREAPGAIDGSRAQALHAEYARDWSRAFNRRLRFAAAYSNLAMRPVLAAPASAALRRWPRLLTEAARRAGKARQAVLPRPLHEEPA